MDRDAYTLIELGSELSYKNYPRTNLFGFGNPLILVSNAHARGLVGPQVCKQAHILMLFPIGYFLSPPWVSFLLPVSCLCSGLSLSSWCPASSGSLSVSRFCLIPSSWSTASSMCPGLSPSSVWGSAFSMCSGFPPSPRSSWSSAYSVCSVLSLSSRHFQSVFSPSWCLSLLFHLWDWSVHSQVFLFCLCRASVGPPLLGVSIYAF